MSKDVFDSALFYVEVVYLELILVFYLKLSKKHTLFILCYLKEYRIFFIQGIEYCCLK